MSQKTNPVLDELRATYKTFFITPVAAGKELGFAEKTTRNMMTQGRFPLTTEPVGSRLMVSIFVLADYVARRSQMPLEPSVEKISKKRGRPTKAEKMLGKGGRP